MSSVSGRLPRKTHKLHWNIYSHGWTYMLILRESSVIRAPAGRRSTLWHRKAHTCRWRGASSGSSPASGPEVACTQVWTWGQRSIRHEATQRRQSFKYWRWLTCPQKVCGKRPYSVYLCLLFSSAARTCSCSSVALLPEMNWNRKHKSTAQFYSSIRMKSNNMELSGCRECCRLWDAFLYFFLCIFLPARCFWRRQSGSGMEDCSAGGRGSSGFAGLETGPK